MQSDITSFFRSCDVCQKTVAKGSVFRETLGDMPLIDTSFRRAVVGLIGPISPADGKDHKYVFTVVDYAIDNLNLYLLQARMLG